MYPPPYLSLSLFHWTVIAFRLTPLGYTFLMKAKTQGMSEHIITNNLSPSPWSILFRFIVALLNEASPCWMKRRPAEWSVAPLNEASPRFLFKILKEHCHSQFCIKHTYLKAKWLISCSFEIIMYWTTHECTCCGNRRGETGHTYKLKRCVFLHGCCLIFIV